MKQKITKISRNVMELLAMVAITATIVLAQATTWM